MTITHEEDGIKYEKISYGLDDDPWESWETHVKPYELRIINKKLHYIVYTNKYNRGLFRKPTFNVFWREYKSPESYKLKKLQDDLKKLKTEFEDFASKTQDIFSEVAIRLDRGKNELS